MTGDRCSSSPPGERGPPADAPLPRPEAGSAGTGWTCTPWVRGTGRSRTHYRLSAVSRTWLCQRVHDTCARLPWRASSVHGRVLPHASLRHAHVILRLHVGALRQQRPNHLRMAIVRRSDERRPSTLRRTQASRSAPASAVLPTPSALPAPARSELASQPAPATAPLTPRAAQSRAGPPALFSMETAVYFIRAATQRRSDQAVSHTTRSQHSPPPPPVH